MAGLTGHSPIRYQGKKLSGAGGMGAIYRAPLLPRKRKSSPLACLGSGLALLSCLLVLTVISGWQFARQSLALGLSNPLTPSTAQDPQSSAPGDAANVEASIALGAGSAQTGSDGMLLLQVPAGSFVMGSRAGEPDERPEHTVSLDAFLIDQTEVTNAMYARCIQALACQPPKQSGSFSRKDYFHSPEYADHPVIYVSWNDAANYCAWAGRRLPTEAEWEKAARGTDGRAYPRGNNPPDFSLANYSKQVGDTTRVGQYPAAASPYGALDMAGNVWEWVSDWYSDTYYSQSSAANPAGPATGKYHVLRGGSWYVGVDQLRVSIRGRGAPTDWYYDFGFRCAKNAAP